MNVTMFVDFIYNNLYVLFSPDVNQTSVRAEQRFGSLGNRDRRTGGLGPVVLVRLLRSQAPKGTAPECH